MATPDPSSDPPGWFADPAGAYPRRLWTGSAWSNRVVDERGREFLDKRDMTHHSMRKAIPAPSTATRTSTQRAASRSPWLVGWHRDPAGAFPWRWWDGAVWTELVLNERGREVIDTRQLPECPAPTSELHSRRRSSVEHRSYDGLHSGAATRISPPLGYSGGGVRVIHLETNGLAIASFVLSLVGGSVLAIIFGHVARRQIARSAGRQSGDGLAVAGLVLGYVWVAVLLVLLVVF